MLRLRSRSFGLASIRALLYNSEIFSYNSEKVKTIHSIPCFRMNGNVDISAKRRVYHPVYRAYYMLGRL